MDGKDKPRCEPTHRSWSHPGLIAPPEGIKDHAWESTTHDNYRQPRNEVVVDSKDYTRQMMEQFYWQQAIEEEILERTKPLPVEEYVTEYEGNFNTPDFKPNTEKLDKDSELYKKYPLYSDYPLSYWQHKDITGTTKSANPLHPFRKNGQFSKPLADMLDDPRDRM